MQSPFMTDYITNKQNCQILANRIKDYWHSHGYYQVDTWVEPVAIYNSNGDKLATRYEIASNIKQRVPQI